MSATPPNCSPSGAETTTCPLREAIGAAEIAHGHKEWMRRHYDDATHPQECDTWHGPIEGLLARGVLSTEPEVLRRVRIAVADDDYRVRAAEAAVGYEKLAGARDRVRLEAVYALVDVRRKTLRMDDLRAALDRSLAS